MKIAGGEGGWARRFKRGLVVVNPSSTAQLTLAAPDDAWTSFTGEPLPLLITVPPASARVVLPGSDNGE